MLLRCQVSYAGAVVCDPDPDGIQTAFGVLSKKVWAATLAATTQSKQSEEACTASLTVACVSKDASWTHEQCLVSLQ